MKAKAKIESPKRSKKPAKAEKATIKGIPTTAKKAKTKVKPKAKTKAAVKPAVKTKPARPKVVRRTQASAPKLKAPAK